MSRRGLCTETFRFLWIVVVLLNVGCGADEDSLPPQSGRATEVSETQFDLTTATHLAALALDCVHKEYPNKISHVMNSAEDVAPPHQLTPVFFGCYDWHSSVHGHWMLARLARLYPETEMAKNALAALGKSFSEEKISAELNYLNAKGRASFERPYGIAWFLQLMTELRQWQHPAAQQWQQKLQPLEAKFLHSLEEWLPKLSYPIRGGEHFQTAFAFGLIHDWSRQAGNRAMMGLIETKSIEFYFNDVNCPVAYEPSGHDFLSGCWAEADLMRRVLSRDQFVRWLSGFLPHMPVTDRSNWVAPVTVTDPSDPKLAHLDGLNLSRSWMMDGVASALPDHDGRQNWLRDAVTAHQQAGLAQVTGEHYEGGHWLASFATYTVTRRGIKAVVSQ